jgi:tRNA pseudouridine(38-40) synthase
MPLYYYKLIVAYDGTEFHGFQRQIDNATMDARNNRPVDVVGGGPSVLALPSLPAASRRGGGRQQQQPTKQQKKRGRDSSKNLSIQEVLESAILHLFPHIASVADLGMRFAGRTDKGVHAAGQVVLICLTTAATTTTTTTITNDDNNTTSTTLPAAALPPPCWMLRRSINTRLPDSISVESVEPANAEFDPRRDCVRKVYEYSIRFRCYDPRLPDQVRQGTHTLRSALDDHNRLWICPWALDLDALFHTCEMMQGTHDYSNFIHKEDRGRRDNTMTIDEVKFVIDREKTEWIDVSDENFTGDDGTNTTTTNIASRVITGRFRLTAASFRRSTVRLIVQFCIDASRVPAVVAASTPTDIFATTTTTTTAGRATAPACGLCLVSVTY